MQLYKPDSTSKAVRRFEWRMFGNPLALVLVVFALFCFFSFVFLAGKFLRDSYFPYEGKVLSIRTSWEDWLAFDFPGEYEHLVLETPGGEIIDRFVSIQTRSLQRIEVGDYVIKERGFRTWVRPRGKMTSREIRERALRYTKDGLLDRRTQSNKQ